MSSLWSSFKQIFIELPSQLATQLGSHSQALMLATLWLAQGTQAAGLMTPVNSGLPELEIQQHHVDVMIEDGYAITTVDQVFFNPHSVSMEALYSFPVPEKASVGEFTYWIDGKPVTGEVLEKAKAREIYEHEKSQGRETALTEKDDYRTFDSRVYPVLPQSAVQIRLVYIQPVHVDTSIGRYVYPLEEGGVDEQQLAFWNYNDKVSQAFSFNLRMRSSYPIDDFRLPQHSQASINKLSNQEWQVELKNTASQAAQIVEEGQTNSQAMGANIQRLDKDIVVYWRHQQGLPGSVDMISHKPEGSNRGTFMMTVTPGDDLATIQSGRDWVFVLDLSGSMQGKYHSLVDGVNQGLAKLNSNDRFRIILFNNQSWELTNGYIPVNPQTVSQYTEALEKIPPSGGTNLYAGLEQGIKGLDADRSSAILLVTDGVANVGVSDKKDFLKLLEKHDVRLFSFVMGNSANRPLLEGMTKVSNGFSMNISNSDDIAGKILLATDKLNHEALRDIDIAIDGVKVKALTPARIGSLYRGQQLIIFGHYWGDGEANVAIRGKVANQEREYKTRFAFPDQSELHPEIERLWAYASIEELQNRIDYLGEDKDSQQAIVDIAIEYGLVSNYTSMLVVREEVFKQLNIDRNNANRVAKEHVARALRETAPIRDNRQDSAQPAFSGDRAVPRSGAAGGALGPWSLLIILPLIWTRWYAKRS